MPVLFFFILFMIATKRHKRHKIKAQNLKTEIPVVSWNGLCRQQGSCK